LKHPSGSRVEDVGAVEDVVKTNTNLHANHDQEDSLAKGKDEETKQLVKCVVHFTRVLAKK